MCTANVARSPYAAQVISAAWSWLLSPSLWVESAGTAAEPDAAAAPEMVALAGRRGYDLTGHRTRLLNTELARGQSLILTMTRAQRTHVQRLVPAMTSTTFTLAEFAELVAASGVRAGVPLERLVRAAHARRPFVLPAAPTPDVTDPHGGSPEDYTRAADLVDRLVDRVVEALTGRAGPAARRGRGSQRLGRLAD